ncbi:hypothetical protein BVH03_07870 [Pseudomonas sp. PA15(2017)]|uniref:hypothetical protein n=1 Tax=Pseudomonas sp. PA15(2017) TaxID=1932111 RepID=UPI0009699C2D|nr:hypothetical protein [Pseudomonas sp. PA15(2017)]OLU32123.1 hypothetical protein BVH03_07870 [Pseudomonas sp. PA15(2017)]
MASMSSKDRALHYFKRLLESKDRLAELKRIQLDLNSLVFTATQRPIDRNTKVEILDELEKLIRGVPGLEHLDESRSYEINKQGATASDNSDILDVISAMKKKAE